MASEIDRCLRALRGSLVAVALFSGIVNVLALTGAVFMLTVYDRVIPSGSVPSLVVLGALALLMYLAYGLFDVLRNRLLSRVGTAIKESIGPRVYDVVVRRCAMRERGVVNAVRDLDRVQSFISSPGPTALFDLPWLPVYLGICFAFHFYIGLSVLAGAVLLVALTVVSNLITREATEQLAELTGERDALVSRTQRDAETLHAMGMSYSMSARWNALSDATAALTRRIADRAGALTTASRSLRLMLQSFVLGVGAYLVINEEATGGIIIAGSILSARALAPIEQTIAQWRHFVAARQSWQRLREVLQNNPSESAGFALPYPGESLSAENLAVAMPNTNELIVRNVSFGIRAGRGLGIVGPTGSGKSTLAKALVGLWPAALGTVRLDGHDLARWPSSERGRFIGYMPQTVSLFGGTIAQNIARFDGDADPADVVRAAQAAGVHELINRLPKGYDTMMGADGDGLSGGQMQRIALARALFGDPFLLVLDEPNANLDDEGERALQRAMRSAYERGAIVVIVTHRPQALSNVDNVLVLQDGRVRTYGTTEDIMEQFTKPSGAPRARLAARTDVEETT